MASLSVLVQCTESQLAEDLGEDLAAAGYDVMNRVNCHMPLQADLYADVRAAFAAEFSAL